MTSVGMVSLSNITSDETAKFCRNGLIAVLESLQLGVMTLSNITSEDTAKLGRNGMITLLESLQRGPLMVLACFTFIIAMVLTYILSYDPNRRLNLPPGPRPWPLIGNILVFIDAETIHAKLKELARVHGPMYTIWIGNHPSIIFSGVKLTRDALVKKGAIFSNRPDKYSWQFFTGGQRTMLTTPFSPYWHSLRRVYSKLMLSTEAVAHFEGLRVSEIGNSVQTFRRANASSEGGFDPEPIVRAQMSNIIFRMNFGDEFNEKGQDIPMGPEGSMVSRSVYMEGLCERYRVITQGSVAHLGDYIPSLRHLAVSKAVYADYLSLEAEVKSWLLPIVQIRRQELGTREDRPSDLSTRENYIDVLLSLEGDDRLTDIEVVWILVELVMGATDTTVGTTHWALANCIAFPEAQTKLYEEIVGVVGHERAVQEADLQNLPYLQAFVKETMRMKPVVALGAPHSTTQACQLAGYDIPAKTDIIFHLQALSTDETIWDSPTEFRPERFMELTATQKQAWIPFGLGKRICPGMHMGLLQVQITLASLVQKFEWIPGESAKGAVDLSDRLHFIVVPKTKVCASIRERTQTGLDT